MPQQTEVAKPQPELVIKNEDLHVSEVKTDEQPLVPDAYKRMVTKDGPWEIINGERIYKKEIENDKDIEGHTILRVQTFIPGTNTIKQVNNGMDTIHLFDDAQSFIKYYEPQIRSGPNGNKILEVNAEYDDKSKDFIFVITDIDNNKYVGNEIIDFWIKP